MTKHLYKVTGHLPQSEQFGLTAQLRQAAISISSNIAEGNGQGTRKDYSNFVSIALGSAREVESLIYLSGQLYPEISFEETTDLLTRVIGGLAKLRISLRDRT
ncbi:MAG: four helix bundle protein [Armatimonadetes bacterium]|nr:four helix bundle protein [Armatimonadota bacterium]